MRQGDWLAKIDLKDDPGHRKVSAIYLEDKTSPVPLPSIRTVMFLMGFHNGYETSSGLSQRKGNKINNLPGRPPGLIYSNPQSSAAQINLIRELLQALCLVINKNRSHTVPIWCL